MTSRISTDSVKDIKSSTKNSMILYESDDDSLDIEQTYQDDDYINGLFFNNIVMNHDTHRLLTAVEETSIEISYNSIVDDQVVDDQVDDQVVDDQVDDQVVDDQVDDQVLDDQVLDDQVLDDDQILDERLIIDNVIATNYMFQYCDTVFSSTQSIQSTDLIAIQPTALSASTQTIQQVHCIIDEKKEIGDQQGGQCSQLIQQIKQQPRPQLLIGATIGCIISIISILLYQYIIYDQFALQCVAISQPICCSSDQFVRYC